MKTNLLSVGKTVCTFLLTPALIFCFSISSLAATYYISPFGNDATGNGTMGNPWRTLSKATQTVTTFGDVIHVLAGTYTETQTSYLSVGVSIDGNGAATSIIRGAVTNNYTALIELQSPDRTIATQSISNITLDGQYVSEANHKTWLAIWITGRSNVSVHDCIIKDFYWRGLIFNGINADNPGTDIGYFHATGNKFYNNTLTNCADYGISGGGSGALNLGFQDGMLIYNNTIQQTGRPEGKNGWPIKYWNQGWIKGVKIYNNTLIKQPYGGTYPGESGWDFAIEIFNVMGGLEIYGNNIQNGAIDLSYNYKEAYAYSAWIHDNIITNTVLNSKVEGAIILEWRAESVIIENNTINNKSYGVSFNTRTPTAKGDDRNNHPGGNTPGGYSYVVDCIIRNNLFTNMYTGQGIGNSFAVGIISEGTDDPQINNFNVYNNTIVARAGNPSYIGIDLTSMSQGNGQNINVRNNIVQGFASYWLRGSNPANINGMTVTHNDAYGNAANTPSWPGGNPANYSYNNNRSVNPLFVSATDYKLRSTSPLIDAGIYVGTPYNGIAPDDGYKEYGTVILPISLIDFTGKENAGKNLLNWNTASESNSSYFSIERSNDALNFSSIGHVTASGFSTTEVKYNFTDATPIPGVNYYRLVMIDKDGSSAYSKIVSITNKADHTIDIKYIDLSARSNTMSIVINSTKKQTANLSIIDVSGRTIINTQIFLQNGNNIISKNIPAITKGIYYVKLFTPEETIIKNTITPN